MRRSADPRPFDFAHRVLVEEDPSWLPHALHQAAEGDFPQADHAIRIVPAVEGPRGAVIAFTGHHVISSPLEAAEVIDEIKARNLRLPTDPRFLGWLADELGSQSSEDTIDVVLARRGIPRRGHPPMVPAGRELSDDGRVAFAAETRRELRIHMPADGSGLVILAAGVGRRLEVSIELAPSERGLGKVRRLLDVALAEVGPDRPVFAQVSAGNSAALRAALTSGFVPICGEFLIR